MEEYQKINETSKFKNSKYLKRNKERGGIGLNPGQSEIVKLEVPVSELAHFDEETSSWVTNAGEYDFQIGASSMDIRGNLKVSVKEYKKKVADVLKPETALDILKRKI